MATDTTTEHAHAPVHTVAVRSLKMSDLGEVLSEGWRDYRENPTHILFLALIYPLGALIALWAATDRAILPLVFPIVAGLTMMGPFVAVAIYELSRRRERGEKAKWWEGLEVFRTASAASILTLGLVLTGIFMAWLFSALAIYQGTVGEAPSATLGGFFSHVFGSPQALTLIFVGNFVGLVFAAVVLATNVVSFPMLVDRDVGPVTAIATSLRVTARNPVVVGVWGLIIVALLLAGAATLLVGIAVVSPVLGHASWRLYRRAVEPT